MAGEMILLRSMNWQDVASPSTKANAATGREVEEFPSKHAPPSSAPSTSVRLCEVRMHVSNELFRLRKM
jgi:hypothetical protein